ncbi:MAG TPA: DinB family protein [Candidatus Acidoferrales bacterium]|nr:DinB family protein [Candidatus Acidoferrales bacterium]
MSEIRRILDQMDRAFHGEAWHGPALMSLLEGISAEDASKHTIHGVHSIWELVNHIAAWHTIAQHRLAGETPEVTHERDWPHVWEVSEAAWKRALEQLVESRARLRKAAEGLREHQLDEIPAGTSVSRYSLLHGVVQHDLYHAGQIAILKKALG